jgi:hypothetical protein
VYKFSGRSEPDARSRHVWAPPAAGTEGRQTATAPLEAGSPDDRKDVRRKPKLERSGTMKRQLELSKETLRDLTDVDLAKAAGGATTGCEGPTEVLTTTQTPACPSGATWFAPCDYEDQ